MIEVRAFAGFVSGLQAMTMLRRRRWPIWLDSGRPAAVGGRYDICMADPVLTLTAVDGTAWLADAQGQVVAAGDPFTLLRSTLARRRVAPAPLPFCGGAAGYFGYDLGLRLERAMVRDRPAPLPELALGFYDWALVSDHHERRSWWVGRPGAREVFPQLERALRAPADAADRFAADAAALTAAPEWEGYRLAFARVRQYLHDGDCYQVNLARRFATSFQGDPWAAYLRLREVSPAPFGAYLGLPFAHILSASPEQFLSLRGGRVETRPIKGTRPRRADVGSDRAEREALQRSPKDRAENVMIVDLLRNDLGKVCRTGSVRVEALCEPVSFPQVHHLVSTVSGTLREDADAVDLLQACLPGGSITGAPKRRAMQIIDQLEPARRGVYCGAIGYIGDDGAMDTSIAIRTAVCADGELSYWAGGGLVADSEADAEYQETLHKARPLLELLGSR